MKPVTIFAAIGLCAMTLAGCQTADFDYSTRQVSFNSSHSRVKTAIINDLALRGYSVVQDTKHMLTLEKDLTSVGAVILGGSELDPFPGARVTFMFAGKTVTVRAAVVVNNGSAFAFPTDVTQGKMGDEATAYLRTLKNRIG